MSKLRFDRLDDLVLVDTLPFVPAIYELEDVQHGINLMAEGAIARYLVDSRG